MAVRANVAIEISGLDGQKTRARGGETRAMTKPWNDDVAPERRREVESPYRASAKGVGRGIMPELFPDHNKKFGYDFVQVIGYDFVVTMSHA
jgi:hypothetical protein